MFNWTQYIDSPFLSSLKVFLDLLGNGFYLIPVSVIGAVLYRQKKDVFMVTIYFCTTFSILDSATIFAGYTEIIPLYIILTAIGFTALIVQLLFKRG